jgi:hypothetical protein
MGDATGRCPRGFQQTTYHGSRIMVKYRHDEADPVPHPLEVKLCPQICTVSKVVGCNNSRRLTASKGEQRPYRREMG